MYMYNIVQEKMTVLLSISLAWLAWAGCDWAELFSEPGTNFFAPPCTFAPLIPLGVIFHTLCVMGLGPFRGLGKQHKVNGNDIAALTTHRAEEINLPFL